MIAVASQQDGTGLILVVCCAGLAWCMVRCLRIYMGAREVEPRWWERRP